MIATFTAASAASNDMPLFTFIFPSLVSVAGVAYCLHIGLIAKLFSSAEYMRDYGYCGTTFSTLTEHGSQLWQSLFTIIMVAAKQII